MNDEMRKADRALEVAMVCKSAAIQEHLINRAIEFERVALANEACRRRQRQEMDRLKRIREEKRLFHGHDHQMWDYCIYLGPYNDNGRDYDLGVYVERGGWVSLAAVYGPEDSQYRSGELGHSIGTEKEYLCRPNPPPICEEALRRYREHLAKKGGES